MHDLAIAAIAAFALSIPAATAQTSSRSEVDAILYQAADALGMLRTPREVDRIATLIYSGSGTMLEGDRTCRLTAYEASVRYPIPGGNHRFPVPAMRVDYSCATDGGTERHVEVVAGELAWNETEPGRNATPAPGAAKARLLQLWLIPQGLVKAAVAAGPRVVASSDNGRPVLSFPLPPPLDETQVRVTFDPAVFLSHTMPTGQTRDFSHRIARVDVDFAGARIEVDYSDYRDWNPPDYKSDVLLPGRIVQRRNGTTTLDLTLSESNTYNPYVVMPVPASIASAAAASPGR